jgi:hypothetical protein
VDYVLVCVSRKDGVEGISESERSTEDERFGDEEEEEVQRRRVELRGRRIRRLKASDGFDCGE